LIKLAKVVRLHPETIRENAKELEQMLEEKGEPEN